MIKTTKIAISLPQEIIAEIELACQATQQTRSRFIYTAVAEFLKEQKKQKQIQAYIAGYQKTPDDASEIDSLLSLSLEAFQDNPWP